MSQMTPESTCKSVITIRDYHTKEAMEFDVMLEEGFYNSMASVLPT